jgi:hypothetical protein
VAGIFVCIRSDLPPDAHFAARPLGVPVAVATEARLTPAHRSQAVELPPSTGLAEYAVALGYTYLSVEESVAELQRAGGLRDLERARACLSAIEPTDPRGVERARRLLDAAVPRRPEHVVAFYEDEGFLGWSVTDFLLDGLQRGETAYIIATAEHHEAFVAGLAAAGIDVARRRREGRYIELDAAERLASLRSDGALDTAAVRRQVGDWLARAAAEGRRIRVYGEMVASLWEAGDLALALKLEELWEELHAAVGMPVLCGYPMRGFDTPETTALFHTVCDRHTGVTTESYAQLGSTDPDRRGAAVVLERDGPGGRPAERIPD